MTKMTVNLSNFGEAEVDATYARGSVDSFGGFFECPSVEVHSIKLASGEVYHFPREWWHWPSEWASDYDRILEAFMPLKDRN